MFYEILYETGATSIASYQDDKEATQAILAHHERAKLGEPGNATSTQRSDLGPDDFRLMLPVDQQTYPAERVAKVLVYENHPATYGDNPNVSVEAAKEQFDKAVEETKEDGVVNIHELHSKLFDLLNPLHETPDRQGSKYKMDAVRELTVKGL